VRGILRAPLLHFLILGLALLGLRGWWEREGRGTQRPRIVMGSADIGRLRHAWSIDHGAPPTSAEEAQLLRDALDEEILYREALARGFDRSDAASRERLVRLAGFVGEERGDRDELEREARRLGLERSDLVLRRHLTEMARLAIGWLGPADMPSEADLGTYLARHAAEFVPPERIRLTHIYLSAAVRGERLAADAAALLVKLRRSKVRPDDAPALGEAFIRGARLDLARGDLERVFGAGFAEAVDAAPVGEWTGPVASAYGLHLVWVHARETGPAPALDAVRGRVLHGWLRERSETRARATMATLRTRYDVQIERQ
jgi:peptidyl-prolyl cis-trans isomerase C